MIVLSPIAPRSTGNGLAMRVASTAAAVAADRDVVVVVVPVAGELPGAGDAGVPVLRVEGGYGDPRQPLVRLLAQARWRERLAAAGELPPAARAAPAALAETVVRALGPRPGWAVHVVRAGLVPLGVAVAELLDAPCLTLDLDDDDEALLRALGRPDEADAHRRLLAAFAGCFDGIWLAAEQEAAAVAARLGRPAAVVPNAVQIPPEPVRVPASPPELLFVGNLTYPPNIDAACTLAERVLPLVSRRTGLRVSATLAGEHEGNPLVTELGRHEGVHVLGFVPELADLYARASACVVPLTHGGGTRIKLLEAFAHEVPVVATPAASAGLHAQPGTHLLAGRSAEELAEQAAWLLAEPSRGARIAAAARSLVEEQHAPEVVAVRVREQLGAAARRARVSGARAARALP